VIFVSGYASDNICQDLNLKQSVNFLRKPFSIYALVEVVRSQLDAASTVLAPAG
jgi:FixJ family two-component response regulator